jgi:hypothetical protein
MSGINQYNITDLQNTSLFHEDLNNDVTNLNIATSAIFGNNPNNFQILTGFQDNGDGTFTGGYVVMSGIIYFLNENINSGYYLKPSLIPNTPRLSKTNVLTNVYTMYLASSSATNTGYPAITSSSINQYRGSVTNAMIQNKSITSRTLSSTDFILPNIANGIGATGNNSSNFGVNGQATGINSSNFGAGGQATGDYSSNFGAGGQATGIASSNFGAGGQATGNNSSNFGVNGQATGSASSNFGVDGRATGSASSNFGVDGLATGNNSSNFGVDGLATGNNSSNFGAGGQATGINSSNFGAGGQATGDVSSNFGVDGRATGIVSSNFGAGGQATGDYSSNFGVYGQATGINSSNFGAVGQATVDGSSNFGYNGRATGINSSNFGYNGRATGDVSSNFGYNGRATGNHSTTIGSGAITTVSESYTIRLGAPDLGALKCNVGLTVTSDLRDKADVEKLDCNTAISILKNLNPIKYKHNNRSSYYFTKEEKHVKKVVLKNIDGEDEVQEIEETILVPKNTRCEKGNVLFYDKEAHAKGDKKSNTVHIGLAAQELEKVLKEVTGDSRFADLIKDTSDGGYTNKENSEMGIAYQNLIPFLIIGFQEQQKEIENLKEIVKELKNIK